MTIFTRIDRVSRAERLRILGRTHALYLALCAILTLCAAIGILAAHQDESGGWLATAALAGILLLFGAIHHASEVFRHADLLAKEIHHQTRPAGTGEI